MIKNFLNKKPKIGKNVFISDTSVVIGNVILGDNVNVWFGTVIRGYMHYIKKTLASIVIVDKQFTSKKEMNPTLIKVEDPYSSFAQLLKIKKN